MLQYYVFKIYYSVKQLRICVNENIDWDLLY